MFIFPGVSSGSAAYLIEQSLLFNDDDSAYLSRTPSVAGNRKEWTFSAWVKPSDTSSNHVIFSTSTDANNRSQLLFSSGKLQFTNVSSGSVICQKETTALFRDASAWYSITLVCSTTDSTAEDRLKLYINGVRITSFGTNTNFSLNADAEINSITTHEIGRRTQSSIIYYSGLIALPQLIDGAALSATDFGETDDNGFWNPIEFTGTTTTDLIPSSTGTAEDTGTTSFGYAGRVIANAFDGVTVATDANSANTANHTTPAALGKDWGTATLVTKAVVYGQSGAAGIHGAGTFDLTLQGWNGSAWVDLSTLAGLSGSAGQIEVLNYSGGVSYSKHRVLIDEITNSEQTAIAELQFFTETADSFGTNGFQLDFADTADFGKDVNYTGDTSVTFTDSSVNSGSATTYTFSSQAIGTASADRVVVVGTSGGAGATNPVSSMTIGGVSAVKAIGTVNSTGTEIWYATVTSGTTASVVVNWGGTKSRCGIGVWALTGVTGVGATNTSTSSTATLTVSGRAKDIILAVYGGKDHASVTFTGLTEDYDEDISGAGSQYQAGGSKKLTATGSNTITVTPNTGATEVAAVSAVFLATGNNGYFDTNFTASDQLEDTPTDSADDGIGNYITLNPNDRNNTSLVLTEGNTYLTASGDGGIKGTIFVDSGEHHFEYVAVSTTTNNMSVGITLATSSLTNETPTTGDYALNIRNGTEGGRAYDIFANGVTIATGSLPAAPNGKNIGVVFDADAGTLKFYNADLAASGDLIYTISSIPAGSYTVLARSSNNTHIFDFNFGQRPFVDSNLNNANAIATQNLPADNELYTGTAAQWRDGAPVKAIATYTSNATLASIAATSFSFSSQDIGTPSSDRKVVVVTHSATAYAHNGTVSSMTIGGVSATLVVRATPATNGQLEMWEADVPSGTTATIVVNWSISRNGCGIGVWAVTGANSSTYATATDITSPLSQTLTIPARGCAIGGAFGFSTPTFSWTGLTENYEQNPRIDHKGTGASASFNQLQTDLTITAGESVFNNGAMILASWAEA